MADISAAVPLPESPADAYPPDPWRDDSPRPSPADPPARRGPALFDHAAVPAAAERRPEPILRDVLREFDPLAESAEEQAAHDAWESAESHPPPPASPSPSPPSPPAKDDPPQLTVSPIPGPATPSTSQHTASSSFPSFAAIARTFAIPSFSPKNRPQSLDVAKLIASPATLSSFAAQQDQPPRSDDARSPVASGSNTPAGRRSGASSPGLFSSSANSSRAPEGQFDFQEFLDQMKSKNAEPVSKYLRSYVRQRLRFTSCVTLIVGQIPEQFRKANVYCPRSNQDYP
jgi:hypothetical protein